jgi:hypothetical protein
VLDGILTMSVFLMYHGKFDDDRVRLGIAQFCLAKENGMLYWGGDYQRELYTVQPKRAVLMGSHLVSTNGYAGGEQSSSSTKNGPGKISLDFRLIAGAALRSRFVCVCVCLFIISLLFFVVVVVVILVLFWI